VVLMVPPSLEFFSLVFALFKLGAVLVLIDPGIGRRRLLRCLEEVEPEAFIGVPAAQMARILFPGPFRSLRVNVTVGRKLGWKGPTLASLRDPGPFEIAPTRAEDLAAILFTSGSTGIPKGALYTHGIFQAQVDLIRSTYGIEPGEVDLSTFPPFALFGPALGMTSVLPDMDARNPGQADPVKLAHAIFTQGATSMFGSPALLDNLSRWADRHGVTFSSLRRVLSAGAPVRFDILERMSRCLPEGAQVHTPFGATEALPVASIGSDEVLGETQAKTRTGHGICVGRPVERMEVRIVRITDEPIDTWSDELLVPAGEVGEITAKGPVVTAGYWAREDQSRLAKIRDGDAVVHRMGDLGYFDDQGRLWMCGRKGHRVTTAEGPLFTVPIEQVFNQHPSVRRSALVGLGPMGDQTPVLVVELEPDQQPRRDVLVAELLEIGSRYEVCHPVRRVLVYPKRFPVDTRHNAKIHREELAAWASKATKGRYG
jgi:acyl-CoA synthetase (AMP-forming)/AMP-acid ligase II